MSSASAWHSFTQRMVKQLCEPVEDDIICQASEPQSQPISVTRARSEGGTTMLVCGRSRDTMMLYDGADFNIANRAGPRYITTVAADGKSTVDHQDTLAALSHEELVANMTIAEGHMSFYRAHREQLRRVFHRDDSTEMRMGPSPLELRLRKVLHESETSKKRPLPTSLPLLSQKIERYFQDEKQAELDMHDKGTAAECRPVRDAVMDSAIMERRLDSVQTEAFAVSERLHEAIDVILSIIGTGVSSDLTKVRVY